METYFNTHIRLLSLTRWFKNMDFSNKLLRSNVWGKHFKFLGHFICYQKWLCLPLLFDTFWRTFTADTKGCQHFATMLKIIARQLFPRGIRTIESRTSSILFQHSATKRDSHIYILRQVLNSETTNIWFNVGCSAYVLSVKVECFGLNFQVQMIMLNVESVSWIIDDSVEVSTWKLSAAIILHDVRSIGMLGV